MKPTLIHQVATRLDEATRTAVAVTQPSAADGGAGDAAGGALSLDQAYAVQRTGLSLRAGRGDAVVGVKLGFTSEAKAAQMGVSDVIIGAVTASMATVDGGEVDLARLIHPRIEPEIAFRLARDVDPHDPRDVPRAAVSHVAPALEIIDSRYRNFSFSLADVVADNTSAAGFAIGPWVPFGVGVDLDNRGVVLEQDGQLVAAGSSAAILGHPERALTAVKRMAGRFGHQLTAGTIVLAGAATAAVPLAPGTFVEATISGLGRVAVTTSGGSHG